MPAPQTAESFWARVKKGRPNQCWEWQGCTNNTGYGNVAWHGKHYTAHRVAAWLSGLVDSPSAPHDRGGDGFVLHKCDNHRCCNPGHFEVGTYAKNQTDAYVRARRAQPRGHQHANAKLTPAQVRAARRDYAAGGVTQMDLVARLGVSQRVVSLLLRRESYTNV